MPGDRGGGATPVGQVVKGTVAETLEVPEYTYLRLNTPGGDTWVAITKTPIKVGDTVSVSVSIVMPNFTSKTLNKTFDKLVMGSLVPAA